MSDSSIQKVKIRLLIGPTLLNHFVVHKDVGMFLQNL